MYDLVFTKPLINDSLFNSFHVSLGLKQIVRAISFALIGNSYLFLWTLFYLRALSSI